MFCTGLDNNAAKVISLVESAFDLIGAGDATDDVEGEVIGWPLTNLSNKDPPDPALALLGSTSVK